MENPFGIPNETPRVAVDVVLAVSGLAAWWGFDRTAQGFAMASLTALAGPAAEIFLINVAHLYAYAAPDVLGVPTWIPWVYFCGAPAVGLLARAVRAERRAALRLVRPTADVARRGEGERRGARRRGGRSKTRAYARRLGTDRHTRRAPSARRRAGPTRAAEGEGDRGSGGRRRHRARAWRAPGALRKKPPPRPRRGARLRRGRHQRRFLRRRGRTSARFSNGVRDGDGDDGRDGDAFVTTRAWSRARGNLNPKPLTLNGATEAEETDCPYVDEVDSVAGDDASEAGDADVARGSENARRSARRAALRREVTALQRLKLRLEKVRDALVREK